MEMFTPKPWSLQNTKLALPALTLMLSVLDKTPDELRTCPRRVARGTARVPIAGRGEFLEEDGRKVANYSFQRADHRRYDIPNNHFHDEDGITIGDTQRIPEMRMQTPAKTRADRGIHEAQEMADCQASLLRGEEFLTAQPCDVVDCEVLPGLPALTDGGHDDVLHLPEQEVSYQVLHDVKEASILQPVAPSVVLCAESAAHKSEVQLTFGAGSCLLQTNPEHRHSVQFNAQNCLDCVNHPEEGYGS